MTTTTTGMPTVTAALTEAVETAVPVRSSQRRRRIGLPWPLLVADVVAAMSTAAVATVALTDVGAPTAQVALVAAWPLVVALSHGYTGMTTAPAVRPRELLQAATLTTLLAWILAIVAPGVVPDGTTTTARAVVAIAAMAAVSSAILRGVAVRLWSPPPRRVVLTGEAAAIRPYLQEARRAASVRRPAFQPVAVCLRGEERLTTDDLSVPDEITVWASADQLVQAVHAHDADAVIVVPGAGVGHTELRRWCAWMQDCGAEVLLGASLRDVAPSRLMLATLGGLRLLRVRPAAIAGPTHLLKGAVDRIAAAALLVLFAPLLLVLSMLIRFDSPGRAFYTQTRVGRRGRLFTVYKLRSMRADADQNVTELADANESDREGVLFKIRQDPRITRLGGLMRKYSLDELPQLINVVRGEMSLIGPRPALPTEVAAYSQDLRRRLEVKPGLTGLWQVSGRSDLTWEDTVRLDLQYVDNWSWALDLRIALQTFGAVVGHKGAY
jgi:exopolysaccharide biosynthesis polyprenyl glycosylphosphotransferase